MAEWKRLFSSLNLISGGDDSGIDPNQHLSQQASLTNLVLKLGLVEVSVEEIERLRIKPIPGEIIYGVPA